MAKVLGLKEQRVQFFYDTDFKTQGQTTASSADYVKSEKILFSNPEQGDLSRTNMFSSGMLVDDQTFLTFAVRHELQFFSANSVVTQGAAAPTLANVQELSVWTLHNSAFQFQVSAKVEFEGPLTMTPAGGGPWGYVNDSTSPLIVNGDPASPSIYVLPLPVAITKRQGIQMIEKKFAFNNIDLPAAINGFQGGKLLRAYIDGYHTRAVQ